MKAKKVIKTMLHPIVFTGFIFFCISVYTGWEDKPYFGMKWLDIFGHFAGGISIFIGTLLVCSVISIVFFILVFYADWYNNQE